MISDHTFFKNLMSEHPTKSIDAILHIFNEVFKSCHKCNTSDVRIWKDEQSHLWLVTCNQCEYERCVDSPKNQQSECGGVSDDFKFINKTDKPLECILSYGCDSVYAIDNDINDLSKVYKSKPLLKYVTVAYATTPTDE